MLNNLEYTLGYGVLLRRVSALPIELRMKIFSYMPKEEVLPLAGLSAYYPLIVGQRRLDYKDVELIARKGIFDYTGLLACATVAFVPTFPRRKYTVIDLYVFIHYRINNNPRSKFLDWLVLIGMDPRVPYKDRIDMMKFLVTYSRMARDFVIFNCDPKTTWEPCLFKITKGIDWEYVSERMLTHNYNYKTLFSVRYSLIWEDKAPRLQLAHMHHLSQHIDWECLSQYIVPVPKLLYQYRDEINWAGITKLLCTVPDGYRETDLPDGCLERTLCDNSLNCKQYRTYIRWDVVDQYSYDFTHLNSRRLSLLLAYPGTPKLNWDRWSAQIRSLPLPLVQKCRRKWKWDVVSRLMLPEDYYHIFYNHIHWDKVTRQWISQKRCCLKYIQGKLRIKRQG